MAVIKEVIEEVRMSPDRKRIVRKAINEVENQEITELDLQDFSSLFNNIDSRYQATSHRQCKFSLNLKSFLF